MAKGELGDGVDDQLINESILWGKEGEDMEETGGEERIYIRFSPPPRTLSLVMMTRESVRAR